MNEPTRRKLINENTCSTDWLFVNLQNFWMKCPDDGVHISQRLLKLTEEVGEISGAFISVTDPVNKKNNTVQDIINECADTQIVLWDFLRKVADEYEYTYEDMENAFHESIKIGLSNFKAYLEKRDKLREKRI